MSMVNCGVFVLFVFGKSPPHFKTFKVQFNKLIILRLKMAEKDNKKHFLNTLTPHLQHKN